jgi:hypothetical protein
MPITKSNKHKLSLDHDKRNEEGGCTLATLYALIRSLILDYQISITPLGSCTPLNTNVLLGAKQKGKRASMHELDMYLYIPHANIAVGLQLSRKHGHRMRLSE